VQLGGLVQSWYDDPLLFCRDVFPANRWPREAQPEIVESVHQHRTVSVIGSRGVGKSTVAAMLSLWWLATRCPSLVLVAAPVWGQTTAGIMAEVRDLYQHSKLPTLSPYRSWEVLTDSIKTPEPLWRLEGVSAKDSDVIEGRHSERALIILDESSEISDGIFSSLRPMMISPESKLVAFGRPGRPQGFFYRSSTGEDGSLWQKVITVRARDWPRLRPLQQEELARLGPDSPAYRMNFEGEFCGTDEATSVIPLPWIERAARATVQPGWPRVVSLDPAAGGDENVITYRSGDAVVKQDAWRDDDTVETCNRFREAVISWRAETAIIESAGLGLPMLDMVRAGLQDWHIKVRGFHPQETAKDRERFADSRSEVIYDLRKRFEEGRISIPNDPVLIGQLNGYTNALSGHRTRVVYPRNAKSPDRSSSLLLAFALEGRGKGFVWKRMKGI
jgi:hypothetical protein